MKEKNKEKQKKELKQITKLNKSTKIVICVCIIIFLFLIINKVIMYYNENYAYFYVENIINLKIGILFRLFSYIRAGNIVFYSVLFLFVIIITILEFYYKYWSKHSIKIRNNKYNTICKIEIISSILILILLININGIHIPNFDTLLFKETKNKTYSKEDLIYLNEYLRDKVLKHASNVERNNNNQVIFKENYNERVIKDLLNVSDKITLLDGLYPKKSENLIGIYKKIYGSSTTGLTMGYKTYFDYDLDSVSLLNIITHEYCHTKSITRENETVFCAVLAGINSDSNVSQYSAYLEAFTRSNSALYVIDKKKAVDIEDDILSKCLFDNYDELCNIYIKNNKEYISNAKKIIIDTYMLKNYINYKDELLESLILLKDNGALFTINEIEISIDGIMNKIDEESNEFLVIEMDLNKEKFDNIKLAIKNSNLYLAIYQENGKIEYSEEKIKDPINYYLGPFTNYDSFFNFMKVVTVDYSYDRVVRLLLEYFEKYGY